MPKNSYLGFLVWMLITAGIIVSANLLPMDLPLTILWIFNGINIMVVVLMYMIFRTGNVHWFSGIDYDESLKYSLSQRREYGRLYFILFLKETILFFGYSLLGYVLHFPYWIHILTFLLVFLGSLIVSVRYKLGE